MRVLVTGSKGFIGSHLVKRLEAEGHKVYGFDKNNTLLYPDVDIVFHFAAMNGTHRFYSHPYDVETNDTKITLDVIEYYKKTNALIVFASSSELYNGAYSQNITGPFLNEDTPIVFEDVSNPRWSYAVPKLLGETLLHSAKRQYNTNILILRYFNIYGPRQKDHFISDFIERAIDGQYYLIGNDARSFMYIDDAIELTLKLAFTPDKYITYNVGNQKCIDPYQVAMKIQKIMGFEKPIELRSQSGLKGSPKLRIPDISRISKFKLESPTSLDEGLKKTIEWHLNRRMK